MLLENTQNADAKGIDIINENNSKFGLNGFIST